MNNELHDHYYTGWLQDETLERCQRNPHQRVGAWKLTRHTIQQIPQVSFPTEYCVTIIFSSFVWGLNFSCPEATALVGNLAIHGRYMLASVAYLRDQIQRKPRILQLGMEVTICFLVLNIQ